MEVQRSPRAFGVTWGGCWLIVVKVRRDYRLSSDGMSPANFTLRKVGLTCTGHLIGYHHWDETDDMRCVCVCVCVCACFI